MTTYGPPVWLPATAKHGQIPCRYLVMWTDSLSCARLGIEKDALTPSYMDRFLV